jgi:hypothetical protein
MNIRLYFVQLSIGGLILATGCGGGPTTPTTSSPAPPSQSTPADPTNLPALTPLEIAVKQAYSQAFNEEILRPAIHNPNCTAAHVTSTAYVRPAGESSTLLTLYTSSDGGAVTRQARATYLTPAGNFQVLTVLVRHPQTVGDDAIGLLEDAQREINEDHALFARARRYGSPIVAFSNTNVVIESSQVTDPRTLNGIMTALAEQRTSAVGYDFVVSINIDPGRSEGGVATPGSIPAFIYMGNFSRWTTRLSASQFTSISGAVYHHEVIHHWGWPGSHDWDSCNSTYGFNFRVPPVLLGWVDVDGDGVPEILDQTPYGRSGR